MTALAIMRKRKIVYIGKEIGKAGLGTNIGTALEIAHFKLLSDIQVEIQGRYLTIQALS